MEGIKILLIWRVWERNLNNSKAMRNLTRIVLIELCLLLVSCNRKPDTLKVLLICGGHDYDTIEFLDVFRFIEAIEFDTMIQPHANEIITGEGVYKYDVLVFYDMWQVISEAEKQAYLDLWVEGKGMIFLHHSLVSYQLWDEFGDAIGGRYHLQEVVKDSAKVSDYMHDIDIDVKLIDPDHPVTRGISDFTTHDEGYSNIEIKPDVSLLLSVDHPDCAPYVGWTKQHRNSRIVYLMLGHDRNAYKSESFVKLLENAILWTAD